MRLATPLVLACSAIFSAAAQSPSEPPIPKGDYIAVTRSGCRLVHSLTRTGDTIAYKARWQTFYRSANWEGPCLNGLAHGKWTAHNLKIEYNYAYGQQLSMRTVERAGGAKERALVYRMGDTAVSVPAWADAWSPRWSTQTGAESSLEGPTMAVMTYSSTCATFPQSFPDCGAGYAVYGVRRGARVEPRSTASVAVKLTADSIHWCTNPRTTQGCETVWERHSASVRDEIQRFVLKVADIDSSSVRWYTNYYKDWIASPASKVALDPYTGPIPTAVTPSSTPAPVAVTPTRQLQSQPQAQSQSRAASAPPPTFTGPSSFTPTFSDPDTRVTPLELPGVPSRGNCLRVSWLTAVDFTVVNLYPPHFYTDRWIKDPRALIARNTCGETLWVTAIACVETRMTEGSTAEFHRGGGSVRPWRAGDVRAVDYESNSKAVNPLYGRDDVTRVGPDSAVVIAYTKRLVRNPQNVLSFGWHVTIADLLYGAWQPAALASSATTLTAAGQVDSRRRMAVLDAYSRRIAVHDASAHPSYIGKGGEYPSKHFDDGGRNCAAGNMPSVWRATQ